MEFWLNIWSLLLGRNLIVFIKNQALRPVLERFLIQVVLGKSVRYYTLNKEMLKPALRCLQKTFISPGFRREFRCPNISHPDLWFWFWLDRSDSVGGRREIWMFNELQANMWPHLSISALHTYNTDPSSQNKLIIGKSQSGIIHLAVFSVKNVGFQFIYTIIHHPVN